jgi:hypothetical protein
MSSIAKKKANRYSFYLLGILFIFVVWHLGFLKFDNDIKPHVYDHDEIEKYNASELSESPKTVDVGYFISHNRKGVIEDVFWVYGTQTLSDNTKVAFASKDGNTYWLENKAIKWVIPHVEK